MTPPSPFPVHDEHGGRPVEPIATDIVEVDVRPAPVSVLLFAGGWFLLALLVWIAAWTAVGLAWFPDAASWLLFGPVVLMVLVLVIAAIVRASFRFQISERRVRAAWGVFSRVAVEARLEDIRNVTVGRTLLQRLLGVGSLEMSTAGQGPQVVFLHVARPADLAERVRRAIDGARVPAPRAASTPAARPIQVPVFPQPSDTTPPVAAPTSAPGGATSHAPGSPARGIPVIGLVGGIGAGKSTVAGAFGRLGCMVIDSDARAKAALDRPDVRDALVRWWGAEVLNAEGRVDRAKVASIIFSDPEQRHRLEQLVHPIVREDRAAMIREAVAAGARAVIVDAPLLFEAGVDKECDAVVFVDAPREARLERVRLSRGWNEAELDRRERSQMPVDEKRRRSSHVVENSGKLGGIDAQVAGILGTVAPAA